MKLCKRSFAGLVLALCCAGCGEGGGVRRVPMHGKVTLEGMPLETGSISLLPDAGNEAPSANTLVQQGQYRFDRANGPAAGAYRVLVMHSGGPPKGKVEDFKARPAPNREWRLKVDVPAAGDFEHNIDLK